MYFIPHKNGLIGPMYKKKKTVRWTLIAVNLNYNEMITNF